MRTIGSQKRETLEKALYTLVSLQGDVATLEDIMTGDISEWVKNDHFAGYVVEIQGVGYEYVSSKGDL